jgi:glutamyl-Q tRNA(Asp) synthetase
MLSSYGFEWDGAVLYQSQRDEAYGLALDQLRASGRVYPCACTRRELADSQLALQAGDGAQIYPGTCRAGLPPGKSARTWRLRINNEIIVIEDAVQGQITQTLAQDVGDFVLLRADGLFAYQLAVVVDDAAQGVTHVVRGADLLDSTPRQILLQQLLALPTPAYAHLPVAVNAEGEKLSKQTRATPLSTARPQAALCRALDFLGQAPPPELIQASLAELWQWARAHWDLAQVPRQRSLPGPE